MASQSDQSNLIGVIAGSDHQHTTKEEQSV